MSLRKIVAHGEILQVKQKQQESHRENGATKSKVDNVSASTSDATPNPAGNAAQVCAPERVEGRISDDDDQQVNIRRTSNGETRIGHIYKDDFAERRLKEGDVYSIRAGSAFYLVNPTEGQRLHIICSISTSSSLGLHGFQSFFIGGGIYPTSILGGFDSLTLSTAINVSSAEVREILTRQFSSAIVPLNTTTHSPTPSIWAQFLNLEQHQRLDHLKRIVHLEEEASLEEDEEREQPIWSLRKFLNNLFGDEGNKREKRRGDDRGRGKGKGKGKGPDSFNLFDRKPDYKNDYGWSLALDQTEYSPLKHPDVGVYLVNLTAVTHLHHPCKV
ncbi:hypothetical protein RND71_018382 [Anisodus tanguticus]|uniref:Uncharacterized protein n=1 Tax=Anisodus tanguticus TaxID=243964 RepID=A0AAE1S614_9SOLA|nr:hypothetical protein RND71_018382 [Anisodus tanguticus]